MDIDAFRQNFLNAIVAKNLATLDELEGCTEEEIAEIMLAQNVQRLPEIYRTFLLLVGKKAGKLWRYSYYTLKDLKHLKKHLQSSLSIAEKDPFLDEPIPFPEDAFVFHTIEGIVYSYFRTDNNDDDPPIYVFNEYEYQHGTDEEPLSAFLLNVY